MVNLLILETSTSHGKQFPDAKLKATQRRAGPHHPDVPAPQFDKGGVLPQPPVGR